MPTVGPGGGGTYLYGSAGISKLSRASVARSGHSASSPAQLPRTGGAQPNGSNPSGPLALLALLAAVAIGAGRMLPRMLKR